MAKNISFEKTENLIKESLNLSKGKPSKGFNLTILGSENEIIPFESGYKFMGKLTTEKKKIKQLVFVRIAQKFFIDHRLKSGLPAAIQDNPFIIYLHNFDSTLNDSALNRYAALTVYAVEEINCNGKCLLDLGSADGILCLTANKKGAQVIAVDIDPSMENKLANHIKVNNMNPSEFTFISADVIDKGILSRKIPVERIDIVVANLGPHYEGADLAATALLEYLPNARIFISGGYTEDVSGKEKTRYSPFDAIEMLKRKNFGIWKKIREKTEDSSSRLTFIAKRLF